jgi:hypothetical protein
LVPGVADNVLWPIGWVLWLHLAAWQVGRLVTSRVLRGAPAAWAPGVRSVIDVAVGVAALGCAALLLGALQVLYREVLLALGGLLGLWGAVSLGRSARGWRLRLRWADAPLVVAVAFFATFLPVALDPLLAHDDNVYHVHLPKIYLLQHAVVARPANLYANMPHLVEVFYTWPLAIWDLGAPKLASYSLNFWILAGLVAGAAPHAGRFGAGLVALLYVTGKNVQWHTETAHVEPAMGLLLLAAVLALLSWYESRHAGWLALVGVLTGAAFAAKYTGWFFGSAILLPALLLLARAQAGRTRAMLALTAIPALMVAPWLVKNAVVTGNPIYPNLYGWLGGRFWSDVQAFHYLTSQSWAGGPEGYLESFPQVPINLTLRDNFYYCPSFSIALMTLFLVALALPRSWRAPARHVMTVAALGFLCWAFSVRQGRFLVAWVPVMALAASFAIAPVRRHAAALAALTAFVVGTGLWQLRTQVYLYDPQPAMFGPARTGAVERNMNFDLCQLLNGVVPPDGKVLGLWDNRFFFLEREFYADGAYEAPTGLAWLRNSASVDAFVAELRLNGVTHVVLNERPMNSYLNNALVFDLTDETHYSDAELAADSARLEQFIAPLEEIFRAGSRVVYRFRPGLRAPAGVMPPR